MGGRVAQTITIPYAPRKLQRDIHKNRKRFNVLVCHRRFGKTVCCINELIRDALRCQKHNPRYAYIAPQYKQAKRIAWDYLRYYTQVIPGVVYHESELRATLPNGAYIQLFGGDNPDALRGMYFDGVVMDEFAQMDPRVWHEVVRPAIVDRQGWVIFIGTPQGKDKFYELYRFAQRDDDWLALMYKASDTEIVPNKELEHARSQMGEDEYAQEFECSFEAGLKGAFYSNEMHELEQRGRIIKLPYEPKYLVHTWWDLGIDDSTAIWFYQMIHGEHRFIDYEEEADEGLRFYAKMLKDKPYTYGDHIAPHDITVRELGSGKTRLDTAREMGIRFIVAPKWPVEDGINAVRITLPKCWFDVDKCARGIEAMRQYSKEWDPKNQVYRRKPKHDWTSHAADAFRIGCQTMHHEEERPSLPAFAQYDYDPLEHM